MVCQYSASYSNLESPKEYCSTLYLLILGTYVKMDGIVASPFPVGVVTSQRFLISQLSSVTNSPTSLR
jgi:hypothetical protein